MKPKRSKFDAGRALLVQFRKVALATALARSSNATVPLCDRLEAVYEARKSLHSARKGGSK